MPLELNTSQKIKGSIEKEIDITIYDMTYFSVDLLSGTITIKYRKGYKENDIPIYINDIFLFEISGKEFINDIENNPDTKNALKQYGLDKIRQRENVTGTIV